MKKIFLVLLAGISVQSFAQDVVSGGSNSWIFHTPDDGRTTLYIAPKIGSNWDFSKSTSFNNNGTVGFNGTVTGTSFKVNTTLEIPDVHGSTYFKDGLGDGPNFNSYNSLLSLHWGLGIGSRFTSDGNGGYEEKAMIVLDGRSGNISSKGSLLGSSIEATSKITIPDATGNTYFKDGLGDGGSFNSYNSLLSLHWGLGIGSRFTSNGNGGYEEKAMILFNGRSGDIFTEGRIGIGTQTFGSHLLTVDGSIGAREIKVETGSWSDFVFEKDYKLRTLEEVEKHINENGHLPEIPSEAEVSENGINLGKMDAKLLLKIEELTLYLIEQNKQNMKQQKLIEELQEEVSAMKNE